jgi:hypothetical protein
MTALSARSIALSDQLLSVLAEDGALPIATMDLWHKLSEPGAGEVDVRLLPAYSDVLRNLHRLARLGKVEQVRVEDRRNLYWRRTAGTALERAESRQERPGAWLPVSLDPGTRSDHLSAVREDGA